MADEETQIKELAGSIVNTVKKRAKDFLEANKDAQDFLEDRAKRMAKLVLKYAKASESERESIKGDMAIVQQSMENEVSSVAVAAQAEAKSLFSAILSTAFDTLVKALPTIVAAI